MGSGFQNPEFNAMKVTFIARQVFIEAVTTKQR